jgi:acetamidase/formamidase
VHRTWDAANEPVLTVESGDAVVLTTRDVSDNQITPSSDASAIGAIDRTRVYPLAGPIAVSGAEPGHTLAIELVDLQTKAGAGRRSSRGAACCRRTSRIRTCACST